MTRTLDQWLTYQETTNVHDIELGLDRVRAVWEAMGAPRPAPVVITVGGTNGKGSTVALLEGMLRAAGYRTGCYTSPHLLRYNERVRIDGTDAGDDELIASFERIETARGSIAQTYFEFGTLAAIDVMAHAGVDVAILEVGLGGRLDAVNIIDADLAIITTIDLDHQAWLGNDRDSIGREKAGIARAGKPAVVGELDPPEGLLDALRGVGAVIQRAGSAYWWELPDDASASTGWRWFHTDGSMFELPLPALAAPVQFANASAAVAGLHALRDRVSLPVHAMATALAQVHVAGRLQQIGERPRTLVDVGHNPQAARALAAWLDTQPGAGRVFAVYGALADKDVDGVIAELGNRVSGWFLAGLDRDTPRGLPAEAVAQAFKRTLPGAVHAMFPDVAAAWAAARAAANAGDTVLLFGSFFVASAALTTRA